MKTGSAVRALSHVAGLLLWTVGFGLLIYNLWMMRSSNSVLLLWIVAPIMVVVGDLLGSLFVDVLPEDRKVIPFKTGSAMAIAFGCAGFFWLTVVMPATSDTGQAATSFFAAIAEDEMDTAYEMLSEQMQAEIPREQFAERLPREFREQNGATINGVGGGVGVVEGETACAEGWLDVPGGGYFQIGLVEDETGTMRINAFELSYRCIGD